MAMLRLISSVCGCVYVRVSSLVEIGCDQSTMTEVDNGIPLPIPNTIRLVINHHLYTLSVRAKFD